MSLIPEFFSLLNKILNRGPFSIHILLPLRIQTNKLLIDDKWSVFFQEVTVHYRHAEPDVCSLDVLFLHGQAFTSKTWFDSPMKSLQVLSKLGYNVVAIDLPGTCAGKFQELWSWDSFLREMITWPEKSAC